MWKAAFKKFVVIWSVFTDPINPNFLKAVFRKFHSIHSCIHCLIWVWETLILWQYKKKKTLWYPKEELNEIGNCNRNSFYMTHNLNKRTNKRTNLARLSHFEVNSHKLNHFSFLIRVLQFVITLIIKTICQYTFQTIWRYWKDSKLTNMHKLFSKIACIYGPDHCFNKIAINFQEKKLQWSARLLRK